ncbi:MAG: phosphohistidine phosphatase SixA [Flavisolibacter sp.]
MKTLILVRHAKSSWNEPGLSDFERPLNERGKEDAPQMARRIMEKGIKIDHFLSSPAKRAKKTARYMAEEFGFHKDDIELVDQLYLATSSAFQECLININNKYQIVALVSHNPGITEFANNLTTVRIEDMPTCGVLGVQADTESWQYFESAEKKFLFFDYPKNPLSL